MTPKRIIGITLIILALVWLFLFCTAYPIGSELVYMGRGEMSIPDSLKSHTVIMLAWFWGMIGAFVIYKIESRKGNR